MTLGIVEIFHSFSLLEETGGLGKWSLKYSFLPLGDDSNQIPDEEGVEEELARSVEELDGEMDRFNMECAILLLCELDGRIIDIGVEEGGGESDPNRDE